jgi:DNA mismatch repair protein MutS
MQEQTQNLDKTYNRKKGLFDEYFDYHRYYQDIYGQKTVILFEVGAFYCMYGVNNETTKLNPDIIKITELLNVTLTRADKNIVENSLKNPLMCGIPSHTHILKKYMKILMTNEYTVILITQCSDRAGKMSRRVKKIYSPSTYIDDNEIVDQVDSNYLMGIYFDSNRYASVCIIDLSTGNIIVYEPTYKEQTQILDEIYRFKKSYNPKEYFINYNAATLTEPDITGFMNYLEFTESNNLYYIRPIPRRHEVWSIKFQNEFLLRVYPKHQFMSPIEYIDLEKNPISVVTLIRTIQFAYEHDDRIIYRLNKPIIVNQNNYLILENKSIDQLNLISEKNTGKFSSLLNVIDHTKTAPGRRKLKTHLVSPIIDPNELQNRYNLVDSLVATESTILDSIEKELSGIVDLERRHRKMALGMLDPSEFYRLNQGYRSILNILKLIPQKSKLNGICPDQDTLAKFNKFIKDYTSKVDLHEIQKYHLDSIKRSFLNPGVDKTIDELHLRIIKYTNALEKRRLDLSKIIDDFKDPTGSVQLEFNERDRWHFKLTNTRLDRLKKKLIASGEGKELEKYTVSKNKNTVKLVSAALREVSDQIIAIETRLELRIKKVYTKLLTKWNEEYSGVLNKITEFMADIDVIQSHARTAIKYGYSRPILDPQDEYSYIEAKDLRNPLVERLNTKNAFVPNDISFGKDGLNGILLFSVNGCGKSTLLRSIAMTVVMAQIGGFVPCTTFKFSPFKNILTRIGNQDNIFKGQSTFQIEMLELRAILNRCGPKSLVITDELCSGTENSSATTIMGSTIIELAEKKANFVFATHLHNLNDIESVTSLKNVKTFHLKVEHHPKTGELIYNRKLSEGPGDSIYGLEIAKYILQNPAFIKRAMQMRKEILGLKSFVVDPNKRSRYNKNVYLSKCEVCDSTDRLEVHHIQFQCTADLNKLVNNGSLPVHHESNLVVLCTHCHYNVHLRNIVIDGWKEGIESGRFLEYRFNVTKDQLIKKEMN